MKKPSTKPNVEFWAHDEWCPLSDYEAPAEAFSDALRPRCECLPGYFLNGVRIGAPPPLRIVRAP